MFKKTCKNLQKGFTLVEVVVVGWVLFCIALVASLVYVLVHFLSKFW